MARLFVVIPLLFFYCNIFIFIQKFTKSSEFLPQTSPHETLAPRDQGRRRATWRRIPCRRSGPSISAGDMDDYAATARNQGRVWLGGEKVFMKFFCPFDN